MYVFGLKASKERVRVQFESMIFGHNPEGHASSTGYGMTIFKYEGEYLTDYVTFPLLQHPLGLYHLEHYVKHVVIGDAVEMTGEELGIQVGTGKAVIVGIEHFFEDIVHWSVVQSLIDEGKQILDGVVFESRDQLIEQKQKWKGMSTWIRKVGVVLSDMYKGEIEKSKTVQKI